MKKLELNEAEQALLIGRFIAEREWVREKCENVGAIQNPRELAMGILGRFVSLDEFLEYADKNNAPDGNREQKENSTNKIISFPDRNVKRGFEENGEE